MRCESKQYPQDGDAAGMSDEKLVSREQEVSARDEVPRIRRLPEEVVNRIAAGEVVIRPVNALKELIENSIDAGSTDISVVVKDGGVKFLSVTDNGCGIQSEDFSLICERFTTSKIRDFSDLRDLSSFGFRGEALSSITYVAHLTITSMPKPRLDEAEPKAALTCTYANGKPLGPPKDIAGRPGTIISYTDLFYNIPTRRKCLGSPAEEYIKILTVLQKFAIHYPFISFSCKKFAARNTDLYSRGAVQPMIDTDHGDDEIQMSSRLQASKKAAKTIFGSSIISDDELLQLVVSDNHNNTKTNNRLKYTCHGLLSNPSVAPNRFEFILFINNRLVECSALKRNIEMCYSDLLPKGRHPWVYISLTVPFKSIDVNVHPTKSEVILLHESSIIESIVVNVQAVLSKYTQSRTFTITKPMHIDRVMTSLKHTSATLNLSANPKLSKGVKENTSQQLIVDEQLLRRSNINSNVVDDATKDLSPQTQNTFTNAERTTDSIPHKIRTDFKQSTLKAFVTRLSSTNGVTASKSHLSDMPSDSKPNTLLPLAGSDASTAVVDNSSVNARTYLLKCIKVDSAAESTTEMSSFKELSESFRIDRKPFDEVELKRHLICLPNVKDVNVNDNTYPSKGISSPTSLKSLTSTVIDNTQQILSDCRCLASITKLLKAIEDASCITSTALSTTNHITNTTMDMIKIDTSNMKSMVSNVLNSPDRLLSPILRKSVWVGPVNCKWSLIQHSDSLYLIDIISVTQEAIYQSILRRFGWLPCVSFSLPIPLKTLLNVVIVKFIEDSNDDISKTSTTENISITTTIKSQDHICNTNISLSLDGVKIESVYTDDVALLTEKLKTLLVDKRQMLFDYFNCHIDEDGLLHAFPRCLGRYFPDMALLPIFFFRLCREVDWLSEEKCIEGISRLLSDFYTTLPPHQHHQAQPENANHNDTEKPPEESNMSCNNAERGDVKTAVPAVVSEVLENIFYEAIHNDEKLLLPLRFFKDGSIVKMTTLKQLYSKFERC